MRRGIRLWSAFVGAAALAALGAHESSAADGPASAGGREAEASRRAYARVLGQVVHADGVDYDRLRAAPAELDRFLAAAAAGISLAGPEERKGFYIDLYNACALRLIVDHPQVKSIQDLDHPFKQLICPDAGRRRSLDEIEQAELRSTGDARIHMALVCASRGCPDLSPVPWFGRSLDARLDQAAARFLSEPAHATVDDARHVVRVSQLFAPDWLGADFVKQAGSIEGWLRRFGPPAIKRAIDAHAALEYVPYDWALNRHK